MWSDAAPSGRLDALLAGLLRIGLAAVPLAAFAGSFVFALGHDESSSFAYAGTAHGTSPAAALVVASASLWSRLAPASRSRILGAGIRVGLAGLVVFYASLSRELAIADIATLSWEGSGEAGVRNRFEPSAAARDQRAMAAHLRAPVAQLDGASGFEPEGRRFEFLTARQLSAPC